LEAIASAFALDVPSVALLILPADGKVSHAVCDLRKLGVDAYPLDLAATTGGASHLLRGPLDTPVDNPSLLVCTVATTRGIDLPELTHVFILGIPQRRVLDSYLHMSGRVGRFGRGGKVISILEAKTDEGVMQKLFKQLDITPVRLLYEAKKNQV
jgi:hypothetical protein